jgi:hypothetical protein
MITHPQALVSPSEPPASAGGRGLILDRSTSAFLASSGVLIVAGGAVAAVNSAAPFGHGSWLAAYLVLVGGVSQVVLGPGGSPFVRLGPLRRFCGHSSCCGISAASPFLPGCSSMRQRW